MPIAMVEAPVSLLLDPDLTPAAKVLWPTMRTHSESMARTRLAARSGLTLATIRKGLTQLKAAGWYSPATGPIERAPSGVRVSIPADLLRERRVRPRAKLLYGLLQTVPAFRDQSGEFTYTALSALAQVSSITVRQIVRELVATGLRGAAPTWIGAAVRSPRRPAGWKKRTTAARRSCGSTCRC